MSRDIVFAYDPGVSTGWVVAEVLGDDADVLDFGQFVAPDHVATAVRLRSIISDFPRPSALVAEQFDLRPGNRFAAELTPVKVNAIMDFAVGGIVYQTPGQAKTLVTDVRLKRLGFWPTGKSVGEKDANDVRDAARHLFHYLIKTRRLRGAAARMTDH